MKETLKIAALGSVMFAGAFTFGQVAHAAPLCEDVIPSIPDATMQDWANVSSWNGQVGCQIGDKIFDLKSTSGNFDLSAIDISLNITGGVQYQFNFTPQLAPFASIGTYDFLYSLEVADPDYGIIAVSLTLDAPILFDGAGNVMVNQVVVTKNLTDENGGAFGKGLLTAAGVGGNDSTSDGPASIVNIAEQVVIVGEAGQIPGDISNIAQVNSVTNTFVQAQIPEPATIALLGGGILGLGLRRRRLPKN